MDMDISMDICGKSVDMDMDMDWKLHIHGKLGNVATTTGNRRLQIGRDMPRIITSNSDKLFIGVNIDDLK